MTLLALLNDLMLLTCQQISNSQTHLTDSFGLPAYFSSHLDKSGNDVGVKSARQYVEADKIKCVC